MHRISSRRFSGPIAAAILLLSAASACRAGGIVTKSNFDVNRDDWTRVEESGGVFTKNGDADWTDGHGKGNPGGFLYFNDSNSPGTDFVSAPGKFLGDYNTLGLNGPGQLSFDHKIITNTATGLPKDYEIVLVGSAGMATWEQHGPTTSTTGWVTQTAYLTGSKQDGWTVDAPSWSALLDDITAVYIKMELVDNNGQSGTLDEEGIDNVILRSVPEPGSLTLAGICLAGVGTGAWRRWRRRLLAAA